MMSVHTWKRPKVVWLFPWKPGINRRQSHRIIAFHIASSDWLIDCEPMKSQLEHRMPNIGLLLIQKKFFIFYFNFFFFFFLDF